MMPLFRFTEAESVSIMLALERSVRTDPEENALINSLKGRILPNLTLSLSMFDVGALYLLISTVLVDPPSDIAPDALVALRRVRARIEPQYRKIDRSILNKRRR